MKSALIAGASGLTGKNLLYTLLSDKIYSHVYILVRKELAIKDPKLTQLVVSYDSDQDMASLPLVDDVFCCLGTTIKKAGSEAQFIKVDKEYPIRLAKFTSEKKCNRFIIITALGANKSSSIFYNRVKGETEEAIAHFPFESILICRPSLLLGDRAEMRIGEEIGKKLALVISLFLFGPLSKYKAIESMIVARAMIQLANSGKTGTQRIESDQLQELGKQYKA